MLAAALEAVGLLKAEVFGLLLVWAEQKLARPRDIAAIVNVFIFIFRSLSGAR
jgi:hypothetical protein